MNEAELNQKLETIVKLAQSKIITFLSDYTNENIINKVKEVFDKNPVILGNIEKEVSEFGKTTTIGGLASESDIAISKDDVMSVSLDEEYEVDRMLGTIIHEYAHQFRKMNSQYGNMFEESFATIFAETCVNYSKMKNIETHPQSERFQMQTSVEYTKAESQVKGLMFVLRERNMDINLMLEYILGNEKYFQQVCSQVFGQGFNDYYNEAINLQENKQYSNKSEKLLVELLANYIKNNDISVKKYYQGTQLDATNLYSTGSPIFVESVVNAGQSSLRPEEQDLFRYFEYSTKVNREEQQFVVDEKRTRIQNMISQKYGLVGKTPEQLHETLMDLCSDYIQFKNRTDDERMIYFDEIKKIIPNIEEFSTTFKQLRISGLDNKITQNLDLNNISYSSLFTAMNGLIPKKESETTNIQQTPKPDLIFYHGGAEPTFSIDQLDVLRKSQKQQTQSNSYAGFYMYSEQDRDGAFNYAEQENRRKNTTTKGVVKIVLGGNVNTYQVPPFSITRITQDQLIQLQQQGYDLIAGKMLGKTEYVLLNKGKIKDMSFESMDKRYIDEKEMTSSINDNNSISSFREARASEMERRNQIRQQQLSYAQAIKMSQAEFEQYSQSVGGFKK